MNLKNIFLVLSLLTAWEAAGQSYPRNSLIEDFSNEECHPCHDMAVYFHPAIISLSVNDTGAHINLIAYQLDFPGSDPSYNLHAQQRADFYSIVGIPFARLNGNRGVNPQFTQQQYYDFFDTSRNTTTNIKLSGSYQLNTAAQQITANVTATSSTALNGPYKIYTAIVERYYQSSSSSIGMNDYYFVMRRMLPDGQGRNETTWAAHIPKQFQYTAPYQSANPPAVGSFDFWGNPLLSDMVAFVQDTITKEILQSQVFKPSFPTSVQEQNAQAAWLVYPNPAQNNLSIGIALKIKTEVSFAISDLTGKILYHQEARSLPAGRTVFNVATASFPSGNYFLTLSAGKEKSTEPITIAH